MSKFYGEIQGNRGCATRGGSKNSGFRSSCQSWDGSVITEMYYDSNDQLMVIISTSNGSSAYGNEIFRGSLQELERRLKSDPDESSPKKSTLPMDDWGEVIR